MLIFTAPSGAGKTTIVRHLLKQFDELSFSVSATNRPLRDGEVHGVSYYFLSDEDFQRCITDDKFAEHEEVYPGRFYGTLKSEIERIWAEGKTIVFDIEVKGATNLKKMYPRRATTIFINPPSEEALFQRLRDRSTETEEQLRVRMERAVMELGYVNSFDRVLVNDDLAIALAEAEKIVSGILSS
ncbi:guanylate kinase [Neolewinella antarctica]|uniref:Guanylate kinase n=1 Tax=Neolewinella antarctica TaxID=442734 RepID=A0ABX0X9E8_9BACT|nr:guanylate kinase [Neolewinella antarctica]NJC25890.1 guanylate kinase [Neolewinella antarctica]